MIGRWLAALAALWISRRPRRRKEPPPIVAAAGPSPGTELLVLALLGVASLAAVAFVVVYALDRLPAQTQFLGLSIGVAFASLSAALILIGHRLVPQEELSEVYPEPEHRHEQQDVLEIVGESGNRFTRGRLLKVAAAGTGGAIATALITPALSLGPAFDLDRLYDSPWSRGRRLVDHKGRPYRARDIGPDTFYTAYPEGKRWDDVAAPIVLVRLDPADLQLPDGRANWAPQGILAYSKTCTHASCAISLYRKPLFDPTSPRPALVCPCHYSTFDPATGGTVLFGPAGRPLPQLPITIDGNGELRAGGPFSAPVGASWWGVRLRSRSSS
jgi:ubiquinol-cytochrome c reductase iron-sulfur subunit